MLIVVFCNQQKAFANNSFLVNKVKKFFGKRFRNTNKVFFYRRLIALVVSNSSGLLPCLIVIINVGVK